MTEELENEVRVFGPPGTGKTTWMAGSVRKTAKERATSRIVVGSFTRAAATEIAGRHLPLEREQVGTLHALAYRAIGRPGVAEERLSEWNRQYPPLALSGGRRALDEAPAPEGGGAPGDEIMQRVEVFRARRIPVDRWPAQARYFVERWTEWKRGEEVVDFTDMIEMALEGTESAPGDPVVGFFDEVQDFTPLELALVRHWGRHMDRVVLAGDDDQCIYSFKGSTPDAFLDPPVPDSQKRVLGQSYRVPRAVHRVAQAWVELLTRREPKEYLPRDADGTVRVSPLHWRDGDQVARDVSRRVEEGQSVMVLSTCSYMLDRVKHALRAEGVPFHNPYRRARGDWNPLRASRGISAAERVHAYAVMDERQLGEDARLWTGEDVRRWAGIVRKRGVFRRGADRRLRELPDRELSYEEVAELFEDDADLERITEPSLRWLREHLLASARAEYPLAVAERRGVRALSEQPRVVLGTIHSVKGGEAEVVYLFPDLSLAGAREWDQSGPGRDAVIRQMYVGMTRASEELVVCQPSSPLAVDPALLLRGARRGS